VPASPKQDTAGEIAYRLIRADVLMGRLPPGRKLKLEQLSKDYRVSISTLRELLNRLASEKLVLAEGQRGFEISPVSVEDLKEIAALRQLLEAHAIERSFARGDLDWEARVVAAHHKLASLEARRKAGDHSETESWKRYDWQFHQTLISACGSRTLMETHAGVFDKYLRYQMLALSDRGDIAVREHRTLLECALKRDHKTATETLMVHISGGVAHALATGTIA
jgi:DNA-binding GntR family transcriptional regulator